MEYLNPPNTATTQAPAVAADHSTDRSSKESSLDIRGLLFKLLRNWWLLLIGLAIGYGVAKLYLRYRELNYEVSAVVQIADDPAQGVSEQVIVPNITGEKLQNLENEIQLMKSRSLLLKVVRRLGLDVEMFTDGRVRNVSLYNSEKKPVKLELYEPDESVYGKLLTLEVLSDDRFAFGEGEVLDTFRFDLPFVSSHGKFRFVRSEYAVSPYKRVLIQFRDPVLVARQYANKLEIRPMGGSDMLAMNLEDQLPQRAVDIINGVISVYDSITISIKNQSTDRTLAFIDERVSEFSNDLDQVEERAEDFIRANNLLVDIPTNLSIELAQFQQAELQLAELKLQLTGIDNLATYLQSDTTSNQLIPFTSEVANLNLSNLIQEYNTLLLQRERYLSLASSSNPVVSAMLEPLYQLKNDILDGIADARKIIEAQISELQEENNDILNSIRGVPAQRRQLLGIEREQQIKEQLYLFLLQKKEETGLTQAITASNLRVVETPLIEGATGPGPGQIYLIGLLVGLLIPAAGITAAELLDNTVKSTNQIKRITSAPILGTIAENKTGDQLVVREGSHSPVAEMFRMLRTNVQFVGAGRKQKVILITSSMSGEGKTFICLNLGASLALAGNRIVLVGMDLRKPKLGRYIDGGEGEGVGLSNYLIGEASLEEITRVSKDYPNLHYITAGTIPPNPAEMLMLDQTKDFIAKLREQYEYVLIDTPPVALVTDALLLREQVDTALYVTRFATTNLRQVEFANELARDNKLPHLSIVFNGIKTGRSYGYGGYGYGYGYGYYTKD